MSKLEVGDKVTIKEHKSRVCGMGCRRMSEPMRKYIGKSAVIKEHLVGGGYMLDTNNREWSDCMLDKIHPLEKLAKDQIERDKK